MKTAEIIFKINWASIFKQKELEYFNEYNSFPDIIVLSKDFYDILINVYKGNGKDTEDFRARGMLIVMVSGMKEFVCLTKEIDVSTTNYS